jgi:tetratricopeptide (TPR) repeat protein
MNKEEILRLFYKDKNYSKIKELLENSNESWSFNMLGDIAIQEQEPEKAFVYYNQAENIFGCAYCKFLQGDLDEARILATLIRNSSPSADWLYSITSLLLNDLSFLPSYFQIRNFYEQDLEMLFRYKQEKIIDKLLTITPLIENINREIYKYSARVLLNNKYYEQAKCLLLKKTLSLLFHLFQCIKQKVALTLE